MFLQKYTVPRKELVTVFTRKFKFMLLHLIKKKKVCGDCHKQNSVVKSCLSLYYD